MDFSKRGVCSSCIRRELARATTSGISALVGEYGRLPTTSLLFRTDILAGMLQPRSGATPYEIGGIHSILIGLWRALIAGLFLTRRRRR